MKRILSAILFGAAVLTTGPAMADMAALSDRFSADLRAKLYGVLQEPADSTQNPENRFLGLPGRTETLLIQPDLRFDAGVLALSAKPRGRIEASAWRGPEEQGDGETWDQDAYVNEWLARLTLRKNLFVSYGRENLQWGPSFLFSPSNPFFADNGRQAPYLEAPGSDFARLVWLPAGAWTLSVIVNTEEGRKEQTGPDPFERIYAAKLDYMGTENYASLICSHQDEAGGALGLLGGWTVSDGLLVYAEGSVREGSRSLYPEEDLSPRGGSMTQSRKDDTDLEPVLLAGGAYTFEGKGTLTLEYAYNDQGYTRREAKAYYDLRRAAARSFDGGMGPARMTLGQTADTGLRLLRRQYGLLQYVQNNIYNVLDITLRHTRNFDDGSCQSTGIVTFSPLNHISFFSAGTLNGGGGDTEFGSITRYQWTLGMTYTF